MPFYVAPCQLAPTDNITVFGDVEVSLQTRSVRRTSRQAEGSPQAEDSQEIKLTHREFELLAYFLRHPNRVFTREELLLEVWQTRSGFTTHRRQFSRPAKSKA